MELVGKTNHNSLYMLSGLAPYRHPYISNVCFINRDNKALIKQVYIEPNKPIEFVGPALDNIIKVYISGNNDKNEKFNKYESIKLVVNEKNIFPLLENKDDKEAQDLVVYDVNVKEVLKDPIVIKNNINKGILEYHFYKDQLLVNSLYYTLYGAIGLIFVKPELCMAFGIGGLLNMLYLLLLYKQIDNVGKDNDVMYNYITRLSLLVMIVYTIMSKMEINTYEDYIYIISCLLGFMTGKLALITTSAKNVK